MSEVRDVQDTRSMEARVTSFIFHGCNLDRLGLRVLGIDFWQEFFHQASEREEKLDGTAIRTFVSSHLNDLTEEMFARVSDRMNLLFILRRFVDRLCYIQRLSFFSGLAFDIMKISHLTGRFYHAIHEARSNLSYCEAEVKLTEDFNINVEYIVLDVMESNYLERYLCFVRHYPDIVVLNREEFRNYARFKITEEQLRNLPEVQRRDLSF